MSEPDPNATTTASYLFQLTAYDKAYDKLLEVEPDVRDKHLAVLFTSRVLWNEARSKDDVTKAVRRVAQVQFAKRGLGQHEPEDIRVHELWQDEVSSEVILAMVADV